MMRISCFSLTLLLIHYCTVSQCRKANTRLHIQNFETKSLKPRHVDSKGKFVTAKREDEAKQANLKWHEISKQERQNRHTISKASKTPKNFIEPGTEFGHLSELLGLKGSFIPSQSRQHWLGDEVETNRADSSNALESYPQQPESHHNNNQHQINEIGTEKGTLPLDISPRQAALITSTADKNSQRQKFLKWEKEGGSMDTRHFPSAFIRGDRNLDGNSIDSGASKRVSTEQTPTEQISNIVHGEHDASVKQDVATNDATNPETTLYSDERSKDKKGFMGYTNSLLDLSSEEGHRINEAMASHAFVGNSFHSSNEQPLTHEMINKLQLDPAWDAMEAKILGENGRRVVPMPLPVSKIDREMMPPLGEPVGQAYLPNGHHRFHTDLVSKFHKAAGFITEPLRQDLPTQSYYSHYQPSDQGIPQTLNIGGSLVHAIGDPWKNLKQMTYDHADDNFPLASMNQQSVPSATATATATGDEAEANEGATESVGKPMTKVKGKQFKEKESSRAVGSKIDEPNLGVEIGKDDGRRKPNFAPVKGKKFGKKPSNKDEDDDDDGEKNVKEENRAEGQRKVKASSRLRESNAEDDEVDTGPARLNEDDENDNGKAMKRPKGQRRKQFRTESNEEDDQGPRFSKQESNNQLTQTKRIGGRPQMYNGQQWHMEPGTNQGKSNSKQSENTGKYITHKFVNFLSDVAQHLNVDKLSIAEQLVKDVEDSKNKKGGNNGLKLAQNKAINEILRGLQTKRRKVENEGGIVDKTTVAGKDEGGLRIRRKQPTVIKYIWNKGISVLKETK